MVEQALTHQGVVVPMMMMMMMMNFHKQVAMCVNLDSHIVASYLKVLIPVSAAIIIVARVTPSIPTVNIWCAHNTSPNNPIAIMAKIFPRYILVYI